MSSPSDQMAPAAEKPEGPRRPRSAADSAGNRILHELGKYGLVIALVIVLVTFSLWTPDSFFTLANMRSTLDQQSIILMVAFGAMIPLIVGEFDLSIGANAGVAILMTVGLSGEQGLPPVLAIVIAILCSLCIGLFNGLLVTRLKVTSFVATLGTATLLGGLAEAYTGGVNLNVPPEGLTSIGRASLFDIPLPVWAAAATAIVLLIVLQRLRVGREIFAVGANRRAAELTGIRTDPLIVLCFAAGGLTAGIGGALYGAEIGSASLSTGTILLLPAFAGAFLGATAITPGRFNVLGTITGVLLLAFTVGGLQQLGVKPWINSVVQGVALIVAVGFSTWAVRLRTARLRKAQLEYLAEEDPTSPGAARPNPA